MGDLAKAMGGSAPEDGKLTLAEWAERTQRDSPRSGETIQAAGLIVQIRKIRRNRVAEAVVRAADGVGIGAPRNPADGAAGNR